MYFLQSTYWEEIKKRLGNKTFRLGNVFMQATKVPRLPYFVGYIPRANLSDINWDLLISEGKKNNLVYISIDPENKFEEFEFDFKANKEFKVSKGMPTHLQYNTVLNLTKTEEDLLSGMKQKHRYNLKLAEKKGVSVKIESTEQAFSEFLKLYLLTLNRQDYFGRGENYIKTVWNTLKEFENKESKELIYIATAYFEEKPIASWMLILFEDTICYPYGGTSDEYRNVMGTYKLIWEIIKWGKLKGYKKLDLFGLEADKSSEARGQTSEQLEPEFSDGYSRFKVGFGGEIIKYADTIDLIINPKLYKPIKSAASLRERFRFLKK